MSDRFVGRKLVVTGGSSGMGLATAATVVAEGGSAVLIGRNQAKLDEAVQSLGGGGQVATIAGDLNDPSQVATMVETIARDHADTSMLVNSAGFFIPKDFLDYDVAAYDSYMDINRGTFFLRNVITTGKKFGMVSMQNSLHSLVDEGAITPETMADVMVNYR